MKQWVDGWVAKVDNVFLRLGVFAKVDNRFGYEKGYKGGVRVGFININDMYNNDVGKGGVRVHEAHEVKIKGGAR